jgi:23S rRNA-/tRNA-specific pseudouridylate synthase
LIRDVTAENLGRLPCRKEKYKIIVKKEISREISLFCQMLEILYQDEYIIAINKPSGLLVHKSFYDAKVYDSRIEKSNRRATRLSCSSVRSQNIWCLVICVGIRKF